jgi:hypothetical protein
MFRTVRAGLAAAFLALAVLTALAAADANKPFQRSNLDAAAITLEAQIRWCSAAW